MINLICKICQNTFSVSPYYYRRGQRYCSSKCMGMGMKGRSPWNKDIKGLHLSPKTEWKKGIVPKGSVLFKKGLIPFNKGVITGKAAWFYHDNLLAYKALHKRINRKLRNILSCTRCGKAGVLHCANISGKYLEEINDWIKLCPQCHKDYDIGEQPLIL